MNDINAKGTPVRRAMGSFALDEDGAVKPLDLSKGFGEDAVEGFHL